jgi:hypothetical protein
MYVFGCRLSLFRLCGSDFEITQVDDITNGLLLLLLLLLLLSLVSPLCRVSTLIFLKQTMSLGNIVLQLF